MSIFSGKATPVQLQWLVWGIIFITNFFSYLPMDGLAQSVMYTLINTFAYALIIYGNINFLYPRFYQQKRFGLYALITFLFVTGLGIGKAFLYQYIYRNYFGGKSEESGLSTIIYITLALYVVFILSFVFRIALAYFTLKQQADRILEQKSMAELNLLKSQVQPHFLFNTLNNIYYEAFLESPRTALLIGRLSDIMRYFVDESPKETVALCTEIQFLENYIALEKIRIRHGVKVTFLQELEGDYKIPPMLLMTFVENIFKHGINRSADENEISLSLKEQEGYLHFQTRNAIPPFRHGDPEKEGFGIKNLQKRLTLLYGQNFKLTVTRSDQFFDAALKIPLL